MGANTKSPLQIQIEIDAICEDFETARQGGDRLEIESFLARGSVEWRSQLFQELLKIELALKRAHGDSYSAADYLQRFGDYAPCIVSVFDRLELTDDRKGQTTCDFCSPLDSSQGMAP